MPRAQRAYPSPPPDLLRRLRDQVREHRDLLLDIARQEEALAATKARVLELEHEVMPDLFAQAGVPALELAPEGNLPGYRAQAQPYYRANIAADWPPEKRDDAFACLAEEGAEDIIKSQIVVTLPRGARDEAKRVEEVLRSLGVAFDVNLAVPWNTLTAWLREQVEVRKHVPPLDRIGATVGRIVKLKAIGEAK